MPVLDAVISHFTQIRELLNGGLFPLFSALCIILAVFLIEAVDRHGYDWRTSPGASVSCSLFWAFGAEATRSGIVWYLLRMANNGTPASIEVVRYTNMLFVCAGLVLVASLLRLVYLVTPRRWGHIYWMLTIAVMLLFLVLSEIL